MKGLRHIFALLLLWPIAELKAAQPAQLDFARDVRPILQHSCVKCHGAEKQKGGFRLDQPKSALGMSDSGKKIISPGKAAESELIRRVMSADLDERMPPKDGALTVADIDTLRKWIDQGAHWPESAQSAASGRAEMVVTAEDKQHWSYRPLRRVEVPSVKDATWGRNDIDRFILASLESKGLKANPQADRRTLIRRVYFDVIGLPPTPAEVDAFLADPSPDAYEKLVERLLNSPHYGERWGRHWLDVARYADSDGLETDADRPNAYQYRDFVIRALNGDLSYQTFVRWQLAGDEYEPDEPQAVAATGFLTAAPSQVLTVPMVEEQMRLRFNELDDMAATTAQAFLGLTLGCARCHDHKFDAIPTRDYYRLQAAFMTTARDEVLLGTRAQVKKYREEEARWNGQVKAAQKKLDDWLKEAKKPHATTLRHVKIDALGIKDEEKKILKEKPDSEEGRKVAKKFEKALTASEDDVRKLLGEEQRQQWDVLKKELESVQKTQPKRPAMALAITDKKPQPEPTYLLDRGNFNVKKEPVQLGFLTVLSGQRKPEEYWADAQKQAQTDRSTAQRRALADWITDTEHGAGAPLARVMVNRLWQHHFGEGLVRTVNDFGVRGELPSHPELMEWLAGEFVSGGWKLKSLHRAILTSAVYMQATTFDSQRAAIDPDNRLLWRRRPQRLEAEILRDAVLATSGTLNREQFGPAFKAPIPREAMQARNTRDPYPVDAKETPATRRRSVYMFHKRVVQHPLMQSFDAPDASVSCGRRSNTTVAPQALALLNDTFLRDRATDFARKLLAESGLKPEDWISAGFRMALGRGPSEVERIASVEFIERQMERRRAREKSPKEEEIRLRALSDFCQALFGTNEFIYVD